MIVKLIGKVLEIYRQLRDKFLRMVETIRKLNPAYKQPGDGSDGTCDCIGLEIGALRRMGLKWTGIHGSIIAFHAAAYAELGRSINADGIINLRVKS